MGIYGGHGSWSWKSVVNFVNVLVKPRRIMKHAVNQIKSQVCHQQVNGKFEEQFLLPNPLIGVDEAVRRMELIPQELIHRTA
jgi:hypothetical protein